MSVLCQNRSLARSIGPSGANPGWEMAKTRQNWTHAAQQALAPFDSSDTRCRRRLSAAQTRKLLIGNGQRCECGSVVYCKFRKNVVQVDLDGSCGEIELPPHLFVWQSRGYQLNNLAFPLRKSHERFPGGVRCGAGFSRRGRPYG